MNNELEGHKVLQSYRHTTSDPDAVEKKILENYMNNPDVEVIIQRVPAGGEGLLSGRGNKNDTTLIINICEKKPKRTL